MTFLLTLYDSLQRDDAAGGTFFDLGGGVPQGLVSGLLAALLCFLFVSGVGLRPGDLATRAVTTAIAMLLPVGYLVHLHATSTKSPFFVLVAGVLALTATRATTEWLRGPVLPAGRTALNALSLTVALAVVGLASAGSLIWAEQINPTLLGLQPTEVFRYLLFVVAAAALLARPTSNPATRNPTTSLEHPVVVSLWAAAAPLGLLLVTGDLGAALVLAAGTIAILLARSEWTTAALNLGVFAGGSWLYSVVAHNRIDKLRANLLPAPGTEGWTWQDEIWKVVRSPQHDWLTGVHPANPAASTGWVSHEFPLVAVVEQYGIWLAVLTALGVAALAGLLLWCALRSRSTRIGAVAVGLAVMLTATFALPGVALLLGYPFGVSMPLLSVDATSFVLAFASIGAVLGVAAAASATRPAGPVAQAPKPGADKPRRNEHRAVGNTTTVALGLAACLAVLVAAVSISGLLSSNSGDDKNLAAMVAQQGGENDGGGEGQVEDRLPAAFQVRVQQELHNGTPRDRIAITLDSGVQAATESVFAGLPGTIVVLDLTPAGYSDGGGAVLAAYSSSDSVATEIRMPASGLTNLLVLAASNKEDIDAFEANPADGCAKPVADSILEARSGCAQTAQALADKLPTTAGPGIRPDETCLIHPPTGTTVQMGDVASQDFCSDLLPGEAGPGPLSLTPLSAVAIAGIIFAKHDDATDPESLVPCPSLIVLKGCLGATFTGFDDYATAEIYRAMMQRGGGLKDQEGTVVQQVGLAVFEEGGATWVIGFAEGNNLGFAMVLETGATPGQVDKVAAALAQIER